MSHFVQMPYYLHCCQTSDCRQMFRHTVVCSHSWQTTIICVHTCTHPPTLTHHHCLRQRLKKMLWQQQSMPFMSHIPIDASLCTWITSLTAPYHLHIPNHDMPFFAKGISCQLSCRVIICSQHFIVSMYLIKGLWYR